LITVGVCFKDEWQTVLEQTVVGQWTLSGSKVVCFKEDVFVPRGFFCSVEVKILESCWYQQLSRLSKTEFSSPDGQQVLLDVYTRVTGGGEKASKVCPVSRVFVKSLEPHCILLD